MSGGGGVVCIYILTYSTASMYFLLMWVQNNINKHTGTFLVFIETSLVNSHILTHLWKNVKCVGQYISLVLNMKNMALLKQKTLKM